MLSRPSSFASSQFKTSSTRHIIVSIDDGTTTWLFSDVDMELTDGHVFPLIGKQIKIRQSVDIYASRWSMSDVTIKLHNADYKNDGTTLSCELDGVSNATIIIYMAANAGISALTDCLARFTGVILAPPSYDEQYVTIRATDASKSNVVTLPQNNISSVFDAAPPEVLNDKIPVVYGEFTKPFTKSGDYGLAKAIPVGFVTTVAFPDCVLSDHTVDAITTVYGSIDNLPEPFWYEDATLSVSESGRGYCSITSTVCGTYLYPEGNYVGLTHGFYVNNAYPFNAAPSLMADTMLAADKDSDTFAAVVANSSGTFMGVFGFDDYGDGYGGNNGVGYMRGVYPQVMAETPPGVAYTTNPSIGMAWGYFGANSTAPLNQQTFSTIALSSVTFHETTVDFGGPMRSVDYGIADGIYNGNSRCPIDSHGYTTGDWLTFNGTQREYALNVFTQRVATVHDADYVEASASDSGFAHSNSQTFEANATVEIVPNFAERVGWQWRSGHELTDRGFQSDRQDFPLVFYIHGVTTATSTAIQIHQFRAQVDFGVMAQPEGYWVACRGREYGSWITGRSSNYSDGDMIDDPAGIIESILRDELGLGDSDIDMVSFIDAENTSIKARVNYHSDNEMDSIDAIRQICEQATFAFTWSAAGKAKLIDLDDTSPTTSLRDSDPVIIPYSHIAPRSLRVSKTTNIVNDLVYHSRYQQEYDRFVDMDNVTDTASITAHGRRLYEAEWPNIAGSSATTMASHLIGTNGIWSNQRVVVNLKMLGYTGADIELGDWIEMSSDIDPHVKCFGTSWLGLQFLVVRLEISDDGVKLMAIQLHGT